MLKQHTFLKFILWTLLTTSAAITLIFTGALLYLSPNLPSVEQLKDVKFQTPLRVYTRDEKLIAEFGEKRRKPIQYDQIPPLFIKAILAAEDDKFYEHHGVAISGLTRAALEILTTGSIKTGGSTITMQTAKNFFLTRERTFIRKFNEIILALQIERRLSKNEILELYLNKIYFGHRSFGIAAAANVYYGKEIGDLNLAQLAMIAGLPKAPSAYNPLANPPRALERRNWILQRMFQLGYIDEITYQETSNTPITAQYHGQQPEINAPYVAEMVRRKLVADYGNDAYTDGYKVITTVSSDLQDYANQAIKVGLQSYDQRHGYRGYEAKVNIENPEELSPDELQSQLMAGLENTFAIGDLQPAVVAEVEDDFAKAYLKTGEAIQIPLSSMEWARQYLTVDYRGGKPKSAKDVVEIGDVIRVKGTISESEQTQESQEDDEAVAQESSENEAETSPPSINWSLSQIPKVQGAIVSLDPETGAMRALVGGYDYRLSKYNRATQGGRQVGSGIKPFIYSSALNQGFTAATMINDAPVVFDDSSLESTWRPENSGGKFQGPTRLRQALYRSKNLVSIRLLNATGVDNAIEYLQKFGFAPNKLPNNLSLALGSAVLTPLELATAYTAISNGGFKVEPYLIETIYDAENEVIFQADPAIACLECEQEREATEAEDEETEADSEIENNDSLLLSAEDNIDIQEKQPPEDKEQPKLAPRIMDKRVHYIIQDIMQDVIKRGTGRRALALKRSDIAGKTGTTNDQKDAWFSGFNQDLVAVTWVGFDDPVTLGRREFGSTAALPVWLAFMEKALKGLPEKQFKQPTGMVTVRINPETGERARPEESNAIFEIFRAENAPDINASQTLPGTQTDTTEAIEELY